MNSGSGIGVGVVPGGGSSVGGATGAPGTSQLAGSKSDNFENYLIFDYQEFHGLVSQPDSNLNDDRSLESKHNRNLSGGTGNPAGNTNNPNIANSGNISQPTRGFENIRHLSDQIFEDQDDGENNANKKPLMLQLQGMDYLDKTKDKTNYDEYYTFLMGLDFLNISNSRNKVDPILMDQFKSLIKIKEYFVMLKSHIDRITENDSDLWFDELKSTFKLMLHQFENMINSISEQINPVSLSVCFFRCIEYIKIFDRFLHMRTFHQQNQKGDESPGQKFRRSVQLCLLWKRLTGDKTFERFIHHMDNEPFNCGNCEKCKRDTHNNLIAQFQKNLVQPQKNFQPVPPNAKKEGGANVPQSNVRNIAYYNSNIFKDIQDGFAQMIEKDIHLFKKYSRKTNNPTAKQDGKKGKSIEFTLVDRGKSFRQLVTPVSKAYHSTEFYLS